MRIQSIKCGLPVFSPSTEHQSKFSLITRIAAVVFGGIALLIGIFALNGIFNLHVLGKIGGATLTATGGVILLAGLCLKCIKDNKIREAPFRKSQDNFDYRDERADSYFSGESSTDKKGRITIHQESYCSLESFLSSITPKDIALRDRLIKEFKIDDLTQRIKENFLDKKVSLALPIKIENEVRDDELLFQILKLIYLSNNELVNLSLEEIKNYDEEKRNILCLRLLSLKVSESFLPKTLGEFLNFRNEILTDTVHRSLYSFFTKEQTIFFLENTKNIDTELANALFPHSKFQPFIEARSLLLLKEIPIECVHKVLPYLSENLLWPLIQSRGKELNCNLLTEEQLTKIFPSNFMEQSRTTQKMEELSIEILNCLLPKMHYQLCLIPDKHLKNRKLSLNTLTPEQVNNLFPASFMEKNKSQQRMSCLHIDVLNQILQKMSGIQLQILPNNHLSDKKLDMQLLTNDKIKSMFPTSFMKKNKSQERINTLSNANCSYVKTIIFNCT